MKESRAPQISTGQTLRLLFISLIPLCAEVLPGIRGAGAAAWLAPICVLLPILVLLWLAFRGEKSGKTRSQSLTQKLSTPLGKFLAGVFFCWGLFLLVANCARCTKRLIIADGTPVLFSVIVLALVVWMAMGSLPAFVRSCELFFSIMAVGLIGIVLLGAGNVQPEYVFPMTKGDLGGLPRVVLMMLGSVSVGLYALFLSDSVSLRREDRGSILRWTVIFFLTLTIVMLLVLGTFGVNLTLRLERPFFQMVAGLGVSGAFHRLEALVSALWLLGDVALICLLLFALRRLLQIISGRDSRRSVPLVGLAAFFGGELLAGREGLAQLSQELLLPVGSLAVAMVVLLVFFAGNERKEKNSQNSRKYLDKAGRR